MKDIATEQIEKVKRLSKGKHVLVVNDTTEFNYAAHEAYLSKSDLDLGPTTNSDDIGFFLHPGLVVDTENGLSLGFSYIKTWNRSWNKKDKHERKYHNQPIKEKESYRWIECAQQSKDAMPFAKMITIVADRESDIYEEFGEVPDERTNLLIRSRCNRLLVEGDTLYDRINNTSSIGSYKLEVRTTKNRTGRKTEIEIKHTRVKIRKPTSIKTGNKIQDHVELYVVEAKEIKENVPKGEKPIHWIILTTHAVSNFADAILIIQWYAMRWQIELLFNTMKSGGLNIELSELEKGKALKKLCLIAMGVALQINQLRQLRNDQTKIPADIIFSTEQIKFIKILIPQYEGKTDKQKNHHSENTIAWAAWIIARLGGWKGYDNESPPGNRTFKWGLDTFYTMLNGYKIAQKICA